MEGESKPDSKTAASRTLQGAVSAVFQFNIVIILFKGMKVAF